MSHAIVSAANADFFGHVLGLILSIRAAAAPEVPEIHILDVGLTPAQARALGGLVRAVVPIGWDVPVPPGTEGWRRAMVSRPFLPRHVNAETLIWIDSDAWVQSWFAIPDLIAAAAGGAIAIAEERFGAGLTVTLPGADGPVSRQITRESLIPGLTQSIRESFGDVWAERIGALAPYNCGVFALRADSPVWAIWQAVTRAGIARKLNFFIEQNALNVAIRGGQIPVVTMPVTHNFVCGHGLPDFDTEQDLFVTPDTREPIGVLHLTDAKRLAQPRVRLQPSGDIIQLGLSYFDRLG